MRFIGLLFIVLLLTGCPTHAKRVLIIGDSISLQTAGSVVQEGANVEESETKNRMTFTILATTNIGVFSTRDDGGEYWPPLIADSIRDGAFDVVVIELGTNDCEKLPTNDFQAAASTIVSSIRSIDSDVPILWMTTRQNSLYPDCANTIKASLLNLAADLAATTQDNLGILEYGVWADPRPTCFFDGVHLVNLWRKQKISGGRGEERPASYCEGQQEYALWLRGQLDTFFGPTDNT